VAISTLVLGGCGDGGGSSGVTNKPTSADVEKVVSKQRFGASCELSLKDGPAIPDRLENKLLQCPDTAGGGTVTLGSYFRFKDAASLEKSRQSFGSGPRFENGNVAVVIANVTEAPKRLPQAIKDDCRCGQVTGGH
jgi:hypothetical protein